MPQRRGPFQLPEAVNQPKATNLHLSVRLAARSGWSPSTNVLRKEGTPLHIYAHSWHPSISKTARRVAQLQQSRQEAMTESMQHPLHASDAGLWLPSEA